MGQTWDNSGTDRITMGQTWDNNGTDTGLLWDRHGITVGHTQN